MTQAKNLLYGRGEGKRGKLGPNLDTLTTVAKFGLSKVLEEIGDEIKITDFLDEDRRYNGSLDNFSLQDNASLDVYSFKDTFDVWFCDYTVEAGARMDYSLKLATKGLLKAVILPLVDGIEYLSNTISKPDDNGKAVETIKYQISSDLNLQDLRSDFTLSGNGMAGVDIKGTGLCPNRDIGPRFNIPPTKYRLELPKTHPFSLDLTVMMPSFDNLESTNEKNGITYSKNPKPAKIEINNLKTNGLFNTALDSIDPILKTTIGDILYQSLGIVGTLIDAIPGLAKIIGDAVGESIVNTMRSTFADEMITDMEKNLEKEFNIVSPKTIEKDGKKQMDSTILDSFKDGYAESVVNFAWNEKEYPRRQLKTININAVHGFDKNDDLVGTKKKDLILAGGGSDALYGGKGKDILVGGEGADIKSGGKGADTFVYLNRNDSVRRKGKADIITDFDHNEADKIDLSEIKNGLVFIGTEEFSRTPGQIRFEDGVLEISLDKKRIPTFAIALLGVNSIKESDLIL